jgi:hypothetical protein
VIVTPGVVGGGGPAGGVGSTLGLCGSGGGVPPGETVADVPGTGTLTDGAGGGGGGGSV